MNSDLDLLGRALMQLNKEGIFPTKLIRNNKTRRVAQQHRIDSEHSKPSIPIYAKSKLRGDLHLDPKKKPVLSFIDNPDLFHQEAFRNFLKTIEGIIRFRNEQGGLKNAYKKCHSIWKNNDEKFIGERAILENLVRELPVDMQDRVKGVLEGSLPKHAFGYENPCRAPIAVALAHDYAGYTGKPMNLIFADMANIGGTNDFFNGLLKDLTKEKINELSSRLDVAKNPIDSLEQHKEKIARYLTDWAARVITGLVKKEFETKFPDKKDQLIFLGLGGDEAYIISPGTKDEINSTIDNVLARTTSAMTELGLNKHPHRKPGKNPGLGISFSGVRPLNKRGIELEDLTEKSSEVLQTQSLPKVENKSLDQIITALEKPPYKQYKPEIVNADDLKKILVLHNAPESSTKFDLKTILERQLFTMLNDSTGVQDARALPSYVEAMGLQPGEFHIAYIALTNISAINDKASNKDTDDVLKEFAKTIKQNGPKAGEIFSAGGGRFLYVFPDNKDHAKTIDNLEDRMLDILDKLNKKEVTAKLKEGSVIRRVKTPIGQLQNSKDPNIVGLNIIGRHGKYERDENGNLLSLEDFINQLAA